DPVGRHADRRAGRVRIAVDPGRIAVAAAVLAGAGAVRREHADDAERTAGRGRAAVRAGTERAVPRVLRRHRGWSAGRDAAEPTRSTAGVSVLAKADGDRGWRD